MLGINNITKIYGNNTVLNIDDLDFVPGKIYGIVGNNGAGKTTLFSLILDLIKADSGTITSKDLSVAKSEHWKTYTGAYISERFLLDFLTPEEYFEFIAGLHQWNKTDLTEFLENFTELFNGEILNQKKYIRDLSKGNQKKVGIVGALIGDPEIVILDEPFANLDPTNQNRLLQLLLEMKKEERIILISSHDLNHIHTASDQLIVLEKGLIVMDTEKNDQSMSKLQEYFRV